MAMLCQIVVYTSLMLLVSTEYVRGTYNRKNSPDLNFNSSAPNNIIINGPHYSRHQLQSRLKNARTLNAGPNEQTHRTFRTRSLNSATPIVHSLIPHEPNNNTHNFPTFRIHTRNSLSFSDFRKFSKHINYATLRTRTLNSPKLISLLNSHKFINHTLNAPTLRTRTLNSPAFEARMFISDRVRNRIHNVPTFRTRTLNSPAIYARMLNSGMLSNRTLNAPTLRTRTLHSPAYNARRLNSQMSSDHTLNPQNSTRTSNSATTDARLLNDKIFNDKNINEWLQETDVKPSKDTRDTRHTHIDGLMHFKKRANLIQQKKKKRANFDEDPIIPKYELDSLLKHSVTVSNFSESFVDKASEKLDKIQSEYLKHKVKELEQSGRRDNDHVLQERHKNNPTDRIIALMTQFVHFTHNRFINGELLRKKYVIYIKFKIGYVFSCLRLAKQQQMRLYSSMHFYRFYTPIVKGTYYTPVANVAYYLNLYEKIQRLDYDIITLEAYLRDLNVERKKEAVIVATRPKRKKYTPQAAAYTFYITTVSYYG